MRTRILKIFVLLSTLSICATVKALESTKPPKPLNTATLALRVLKKTVSNSHYKIIGSCTWLKTKPLPEEVQSLAVEQYLPDLVVTVSNNAAENPWVEANLAYENKIAIKKYQSIFKKALGFAFDYGSDSAQQRGMHLDDDRSRVVHVIGSPARLYQLPEVSHRPETRFGKPYYSSHADAVLDRSEIAELSYMAAHPQLLINHEIGSLSHSWGPEIPRLMRVTQPSRFRASVVAALHAADIVTNEGMHVKQATSNRCGANCSIANVIYDPEEKNVIWQEVYPKNRNIKVGAEDEFGVADDKKGNGNYIFVLWRKYRGCVKQSGKLLLGSPKVEATQKR